MMDDCVETVLTTEYVVSSRHLIQTLAYTGGSFQVEDRCDPPRLDVEKMDSCRRGRLCDHC
jgi:hypothetical protein